jgi:hypothetical protein
MSEAGGGRPCGGLHSGALCAGALQVHARNCVGNTRVHTPRAARQRARRVGFRDIDDSRLCARCLVLILGMC